MGFFSGLKAGAEGTSASWLEKAWKSVGGAVEKGTHGVGYGMGAVGLRKPILGAILLPVLGGVGIWAYGANAKRERESQNALKDAQIDSLETQTRALEQSVAQPQNPLTGSVPLVLDGPMASKIEAERGGKARNGALDFIQSTPDVAKGAVAV